MVVATKAVASSSATINTALFISNKKNRNEQKKKKKKQSLSKNLSMNETNKDDGTCAVGVVPWYNIFTQGDNNYNDYMAKEWGFEKRGDDVLFEALSLEGLMHAADNNDAVSRAMILHKRETYRRIFHNFHIEKVAAMTHEDIKRRIVQDDDEHHMDAGNDEEDQWTKNFLVQNFEERVLPIIANAVAIQRLRTWAGHDNSFDNMVWNFVQHKPTLNISRHHDRDHDHVPLLPPLESEESIVLSKQLITLGFSKLCVTPQICYSTMQSIGMVVDHPTGCVEWTTAYKRLQSRPNGYQTR